MKLHIRLAIGLLVVLGIAGAGRMLLPTKSAAQPPSSSSRGAEVEPARKTGFRAEPAPPAKGRNSANEESAADASSRRLLAQYLSEWKELKGSYQGAELEAKQKEFAERALPNLGASEVFRFLTSITSEGEGNLAEVLADSMGAALFSKGISQESFRILAAMEDQRLQEKLSLGVGKVLGLDQVQNFLGQLESPHSKSQLLTGYCITQAAADPLNAFKTFSSLRPGNVDFTGLKDVMGSLPAGTDFAAVSRTFPDDSKTLSRQARTALLLNWSQSNPKDTAAYVVKNSNLVSPEQISEVVKVWLKKSPAEADEWIESLPEGKHRDLAFGGQAAYYTESYPENAWAFAQQIGNPQERAKAMTSVYEAWSKRDLASAQAAWNEYSKQNGN